jgi:hypothetical protein
MLKTKSFFNQADIVFWLKIIKIETKNFCYSKILKIYYLRSITCNYPNIDKISPGVYCHQYVYRR